MSATGTFDNAMPTDLPNPPFILLPGLPNLRDIGGYALAKSQSPSKRSVRRGLVFRSADTSALGRFPQSSTDLSEKLGIRTVFDLRSAAEVTKAAYGPALNVPGIERVHTPMASEDMSPEAMVARYKDYAYGGDAGFVRAYANLLTSAGESMGKIARQLLQQPDTPILIHCTAGKDRTGMAVMLLLLLAGCSASTIEHEYALTTPGLAVVRERMIERLLERPDMQGDRAAVERLASSRASAMHETLVFFKGEYGSARDYLISQSRLTEEELDRLADILTIEDQPIFADQPLSA